MATNWTYVALLLLGMTIGLILAWPRLRVTVFPKIGKQLAGAYQARLIKQLRKKYPLLAARVLDFQMSEEAVGGFQAAMKRMPPQEGQKLQLEFLRLRDNLISRNPELGELLALTQADGKAQMQALDKLMKLPDARRAAIEQDVIWAWDQLRGRFPKWVAMAEAPFRKPS